MTPEEIDRTIQFLIEHAASFSAGMDALKLRHEEDHKVLVDLTRQNAEQIAQLTRQTAQFQSWASEVVAIESRRLDEHDQLHNEAIRLLHRILDRLPPTES